MRCCARVLVCLQLAAPALARCVGQGSSVSVPSGLLLHLSLSFRVCVCVCVCVCLANATVVAAQDWRNVCNGMLISDDGGYQDQPQVLVNADGSWSCVLTLNSAHEGQDSQRVVSTVSTDTGKSWTPLIDVEPHVAPPGKLPKSTGWINNLLLPSSGH